MIGNTPRGRRFGAVAFALLVALSVLSPAAAIPQPADTVGMEQTAAQSVVSPGQTVTVEATINASDYNAPALAVDLPDGWSITSQSAEGPATFKPSTNEWVWLSGGEYTVTYIVAVSSDAADGDYTITADGSAIDPSDGDFVNNGASTTITVQSQPANQPPSADAGSDQTVDEGTTVTLDASGSSDPDGDSLSYSWSVTDDAGTGVTLSDASSETPSFTAPDVDSDQTLSFQVEVSDGQTSDTDTVEVSIKETDTDDPAPEADVTVSQSAQASSVTPGETVTFETTIATTAANAPALDVTLPTGWSILSQSAEGPATFKPSTQEWVWLAGGNHTVTYTMAVPAGADDGQYTVTADASAVSQDTDEFVNDSTTTSVTVQSQPANQPPSAAFSASPNSPEVGQSVTFDASGSDDPDGSIESYAWDFGDGTTASGESASHTYDSPGEYSVTVNVTDDDGSTAQVTQTVSVSGTPDPADFQVSNLDAPDTATQNDTVDVAADITNTGDQEATRTVEFRLDTDGDGTVQSDEALRTQEVTLAGGENQTVIFSDIETSGLPAGNYAHGVVTPNDSATATIAIVEFGTVGDLSEPPTDPDGDGLYEDVNGDGEFDIVDVQALFANLDSETVQNNPEAFDYNQDGDVDVVDVQKLYNEVLG